MNILALKKLIHKGRNEYKKVLLKINNLFLHPLILN